MYAVLSFQQLISVIQRNYPFERVSQMIIITYQTNCVTLSYLNSDMQCPQESSLTLFHPMDCSV